MCELIKQISQIIPNDRIMENESMISHTTFRAGGKCKLFVEINSDKELREVLNILTSENEDYYLIGNGSNLLVSDAGYEGVILHLSKEYSHIEVKESTNKTTLICQAGASLAMIARTALDNSLTGFEFAAGIPGSLGGAIVMNAGAYGGEMAQVVKSVRLMDLKGNEVVKSCQEMHFSYRHSLLKEQDYIVLSVEIELEKGNKEEIKATMDDLAFRRRDKQPLEYPSAGSTFKRPEGYFAAKLIDDAGLRGYSVGDAQVSEKHCGFVVNKANATASDIHRLMQDIKTTVKEKFDVELEPEVILLGKF